MAEVPYTGVPSVAPNLPATPSIHPNVSADAFGASIAQATSHSGQALLAAGNELFGRAYAMQQLDQHAAANNALADATDKVSALHTDYRATMGMAAKNGYQPFVDNVNDIISKGKENLTSDYARQIYDDQVRHMRRATLESAGAHAASEFKNYQVGSAEASIDNQKRTTLLDPTNPNLAQTSIEKINADAEHMGQLKGWSPEQVTDYKNKHIGEMNYNRVVTIARTDPFGAQKELERIQKEGGIDGEKAGAALTFIRGQRNTVTSRVEAGKLLSGEGTHFGAGKVSPDRLYEAIIGVESSGNSRAVTPVTHKNGTKDRALGISQILESNLNPWLKEAGLPSMTAEEFLNDRDTQIKLTKYKLGQYQEQYGSANEAARHWRGLAFRDSTNGETEPQYLTRFNQKLAKSASTKDLDQASMSRAKELAPDDEDFHYTFRDRVFADHSRDAQITRQEEFDNRHTVEAAIMTPDNFGKLPFSIVEIQDPAVHAAWEKLPEWLQAKFNAMLARNAKQEYAATPQNQAQFNQIYGKLKDPMISDADRMEALNQNFSELAMPADQRRELINAQKALFKNTPQNPAIINALRVLEPMLNEAGVTKKDDKETYEQFLGTLYLTMERKLQETKTLPKDEEIRTIGAGMLRDQVIGKTWYGGEKTEKQFKVTPDEKMKQFIIDGYVARNGFAPTEGMIQQIFAAESYNWLYGKKKAEKVEPKGVVGIRSAAK